MNKGLLRLSAVWLWRVGALALAQDQVLTYGIFSGGGPGSFNFADNGSVSAVTLEAGGVSVSGDATVLYQGGVGDTTFFYDHTSTGKTFTANGGQGTVVDETDATVATTADPIGVAVDEANGYLFYTSRANGEVLRAPLAADGTVGPSSVFLSGLNDPTSLHLTSPGRLLVGESGQISAVDPTNARSLTALITDTGGEIRGLEEDTTNSYIYYSVDGGSPFEDDILRAPSAGGATTLVLDGSGSFQDILLDEINSRVILANFAVTGSFDVDGEVISYAWDRAAGTVDGSSGVTLVSQANIPNASANNAYFTGLGFLQVVPAQTAGSLISLALLGVGALRRR